MKGERTDNRNHGRNGRTDIKTDDIIAMLQQGVSPPRIADKLNCCPELIRARARLKGWIFTKKSGLKHNAKGKRICACCGQNPVPAKPVKGVTLHLLCAHCWKHGESRLREI